MVDRGAGIKAMLCEVQSAEREVKEARDRLVRAVRSAREAGASYADLGSALGTTRQAAWERFGKGLEPGDVDRTATRGPSGQ